MRFGVQEMRTTPLLGSWIGECEWRSDMKSSGNVRGERDIGQVKDASSSGRSDDVYREMYSARHANRATEG